MVRFVKKTKNKKQKTMKISKTILTLLATGLLSCGIFSQQAQAGFISGQISFSGSAIFNTTNLAAANTVTHFKDINNVDGKATVVGVSTGSFSGIVSGTQASFTQPYQFNPSVGVTALWSVGGFTFDLLTSAIVTQTSTFLNITGTGTLHNAGFTDTAGVWNFTVSNASGSPQDTFSFAASTSAVPEGGSALALLGLGLVAVELLRRKLVSA
jgi:hypothetical protein